jgi:hypothetical protein
LNFGAGKSPHHGNSLKKGFLNEKINYREEIISTEKAILDKTEEASGGQAAAIQTAGGLASRDVSICE